MDVNDRIKEAIESNPVVIFMKGSPDMPQCGFSMQTVQALKACNVEFAYVDVLADPEVRSGLKSYSNWPTFPQLYINGELIGGCDIVLDLFQKGELQPMVQEAVSTE
ncbi:MAG TPA: Grx4 family monothiol glutaredoxin [Gammaproteobacteria bacterium]|nr:Grx4 family monothiol glutaredoxin [Gammaproteobacteria bacterium]